MPTEPLKSFLYRELSISQAKPIIDIVSPLLRELNNYGSNLIIRCATSVNGKPNEDLAPFSIYRQLLELSDAFEVLIINACAMPTIPIIRSYFEGLLSLQYILESHDKYVQRSLSWLSSYLHQKRNLYEACLIDTLRGKQFQAILRKDRYVGKNPILDQKEVEKALINLNEILQSDQFQEIEAEISRNGSSVEWYGLFNGPKSFYELASYLHRDAQYDFLYRYWSQFSHAQDFSKFLIKTATGKPAIRGIRDPEPIVDLSRFMVTNMVNATIILLKFYRPEEAFRDYYLREIRPKYQQLLGRK